MLAEGVVQQSTSRDQLIESTTDFIGRRESTAYRSLQIVPLKALVRLLETFCQRPGGARRLRDQKPDQGVQLPPRLGSGANPRVAGEPPILGVATRLGR